MIRVRPTTTARETMIDINAEAEIHEMATERGLYTVGKIVGERVKQLIRNPPKTGRVYFIRGRAHQASAPGEPPANLTGTLVRSYGFDVRGPRQLVVGESAPYAKYLEDGTKKMSPRPHLIRAIKETAGGVADILRREFKVTRRRQ